MEFTFNTSLEITSPEELIKVWNKVYDPSKIDTELDMDFTNVETVTPFAATVIYGIMDKFFKRDYNNSVSRGMPINEKAYYQMEFLLRDFADEDDFDEIKDYQGIEVSSVESDFKEKLDTVLSFIQKNIKGKFPNSVQKLVHISLNECLDNIFNHAGETTTRLIAGDVEGVKERIYLTILDDGIGIRQGLQKYGKYKDIKNDKDALLCAIEDGTSGQLEGKRGKGLFILNNFVRANGGVFHILSGNALLESSVNGVFVKTLKNSFQGTIINIELIINKDFYFNLDDLMDDAEAIF